MGLQENNVDSHWNRLVAPEIILTKFLLEDNPLIRGDDWWKKPIVI